MPAAEPRFGMWRRRPALPLSKMTDEVIPSTDCVLPEQMPRLRLLPNPRPSSNAGARLVGGLAAVLVASSLTMVSASAVGAHGALMPEATKLIVDTLGDPTEPPGAADSTDPTEPSGPADSSDPADSSEPAEPAALGSVRPAILATTGGNLIPLGLLAMGLTCIGISAVMTRRRTVPTITANMPMLTERDAP